MIGDTSTKSYLDALRNINKTARARSTHSSNVPSQKVIAYQDSTTDIPKLSLPLPQAIAQSLIKAGCPLPAAKQLSDTYLRLARTVHSRYESTHRQTCNKLAYQLICDPGIISSFKQLTPIVEKQYQDEILAIERRAINRAHELQSRATQQTVLKPTFNQEFVPFLEKYFEYNAYPSAPDRASLARKSMMTPRQIEVWFQNHRNRAKKEGKSLRRLTSDPLPLKLSLESLEKTMPLFVIPEKDRKVLFPEDDSDRHLSEDSDEEDEVPSVLPARASFNNTTPPHAFPTPYPPATNYEPFSTNTNRLSAPVWMRNRATKVIPPRPTISIEELITDFATKLIIRDSSKQHLRASPPPGTYPKCAWFAATYTTPPSAPHPAFIPSLTSPGRITLPSIPVIHAGQSRMYPFQSPSPSSLPTTLVPPSNGSATSATRRKVARLPKRTPKHQSAAHRGASPVTSEASPSLSPRSLTPSSRASSFSSDGSFLCRSSSPSSNSSTASSTLTTPVFSPTSLPENVPSPISISGIDFQNMDDLFGDSPNAMSPLDGLNLNFPSHTSFNIPTIPGKELFQFGFETNTARLR